MSTLGIYITTKMLTTSLSTVTNQQPFKLCRNKNVVIFALTSNRGLTGGGIENSMSVTVVVAGNQKIHRSMLNPV